MVLELRQMIWTIPTIGFKNYFETNGHFGYFGPSPVLPTWSEKYFSASSFSFSLSLSLTHTHTASHALISSSHWGQRQSFLGFLMPPTLSLVSLVLQDPSLDMIFISVNQIQPLDTHFFISFVLFFPPNFIWFPYSSSLVFMFSPVFISTLFSSSSASLFHGCCYSCYSSLSRPQQQRRSWS